MKENQNYEPRTELGLQGEECRIRTRDALTADLAVFAMPRSHTKIAELFDAACRIATVSETGTVYRGARLWLLHELTRRSPRAPRRSSRATTWTNFVNRSVIDERDSHPREWYDGVRGPILGRTKGGRCHGPRISPES